MEHSAEVKKWIQETTKQARWGMRFLYLVSFGIYVYFMHFDTLFEGSFIPMVLAHTALLLLIPAVIFPTEWMLWLRIKRYGRKVQLVNDTIPFGNKLAVTQSGKQLIFKPESNWWMETTGAHLAYGTIEETEANVEIQAIHKESQEQLAWEMIAFVESDFLTKLFLVANALLYTLPQLRDIPGVTSFMDVLLVMLISSFFIISTFGVRDVVVMAKLFSKNKRFILTTEIGDGTNPEYAHVDMQKTDSVLANVLAEGMTPKLKAVTLNGGLLYALSKNDRVVKHMIV